MPDTGLPSEFLWAFTAVLVLVPLFMRLAPRLGVLDSPTARKRHRGDIPMVGGLALFCGLLLALGLRHPDDLRLLTLLAGVTLVVAAGFIDDRNGLSAKKRFVVQAVACGFMVFGADVMLRDFGQLLWPGTLPLGSLAIPVTLFCVVGVTNALNMIDGMDGLSGSIALVCLAGLLAAARHHGLSAPAIPELLALAGGLCAWLLYNLRLPWRDRALAFFGDAGTLLLGFMLGWMLVERSQGEARIIAPVTALWLLAVPLMDTVFVMIKRKRAGLPMTEADREHLHHAFLRSGRSVTSTLLYMLLLASGLATAGLMMEWSGVPEYVSYFAFLTTCAIYYATMSRSWRHRRFLGKRIS